MGMQFDKKNYQKIVHDVGNKTKIRSQIFGKILNFCIYFPKFKNSKSPLLCYIKSKIFKTFKNLLVVMVMVNTQLLLLKQIANCKCKIF